MYTVHTHSKEYTILSFNIQNCTVQLIKEVYSVDKNNIFMVISILIFFIYITLSNLRNVQKGCILFGYVVPVILGM